MKGLRFKGSSTTHRTMALDEAPVPQNPQLLFRAGKSEGSRLGVVVRCERMISVKALCKLARAVRTRYLFLPIGMLQAARTRKSILP